MSIAKLYAIYPVLDYGRTIVKGRSIYDCVITKSKHIKSDIYTHRLFLIAEIAYAIVISIIETKDDYFLKSCSIPP